MRYSIALNTDSITVYNQVKERRDAFFPSSIDSTAVERTMTRKNFATGPL